MLHTHRLGVDTVESAVVHSRPYAAASVPDELPHVYALQLREQMSVGYYHAIGGVEQLLLSHHENASHIRAYPVASHSVVHNVVSPRRAVASRGVYHHDVAHLSCLRIVYVESVVGAYEHTAFTV